MVGMKGGGNRGGEYFWRAKSSIRRERCKRDGYVCEGLASYLLKNDDSVDPADAVSGLAGAGCAAAAGAGSSRFDERFEE